MRSGYPDECFGLRMREAAAKIGQADAGVDQHRHGAKLEQGEGQREEIQARRHHQCRSHAAPDADALEAEGQHVALLLQFAEGKLPVSHLALRIQAVRADNRRALRLEFRHVRQVRGDIRGFASRRLRHGVHGARGSPE